MITAQDKILHVASKLGLTSLKDMQASTGAVYDCDTELVGQIFTSAARHQNPGVTNLTQNQFEVNEALLVETVAFYVKQGNNAVNYQNIYGSNANIVFSLIIGNKRVIIDTPVFASGSPYAFANVGMTNNLEGENFVTQYQPRHQVYMESVGVLIPPQIQFSIEYRLFDVVTGAIIPVTDNDPIACYLFGTRVLLNFNTSI
jgi:hypothetical protein